MNTLQNDQIEIIEEDSQLDIKKIFMRFFSHWPWFILSIAVCFSLSYLYTRYTTPLYRVSAKVLVNDEKKGAGMIGGADMLELGGLLGTKSTVDNEAEILRTRSLMEQVVNDMHLNIKYFKKGRFNDIELYNSPFLIEMINTPDTIKRLDADFKLLKDNKISLKTSTLDTTVSFNSRISLEGVGSFFIRRNPNEGFQEDRYSFNI